MTYHPRAQQDLVDEYVCDHGVSLLVTCDDCVHRDDVYCNVCEAWMAAWEAEACHGDYRYA